MIGSNEFGGPKPACKDAEDFEVFFKGDIRNNSGVHENFDDSEEPENQLSRSEGQLAHREAMTYCGRCVVASECLKTALDNNEKWGIWGGLTTSERNRLSKGQAA